MFEIIIIIIILGVISFIWDLVKDNSTILIGLAVFGVLIFLFVEFKVFRIIAIIAIIIAIILVRYFCSDGNTIRDFKEGVKAKGRFMAKDHKKAYSLSALQSEYKSASSKFYILYDIYKDDYLKGYIEELFRQTGMFTLDEFVYLNQFYLTDISTSEYLSAKLEMLDKNSAVYDGQENTNPFSTDDWCQEDNFTVKLSGDIFDDYKKLIIPYLDNSSDIERIELDGDLVYKSKYAESDNLITVEISLD